MKKITLLFFALIASILSAQTPTVGTKAWVEQQQRNSNPTLQNGNGTLGFLFDSTACGLNYTQVSVKLGQRFSVSCCPPVNGTVQPAPFPISNIPFCAQTVKAYLWCVVAGNGMPITATITDPFGNTQNFPMTMIGQDVDMCWGYAGTYTYRADVTSIVNGNGNYLVSGLPVDPSAASHTNDVDGATLMIIYEDPTATYTGTLHMDDGCVVAPGGNLQHTMTGFTSCANSTAANSFMLIADLQGIGMDVSMNGSPNTPVAQEDWWNFVSSPTTLAQFQDSCDYFLNTSSSGDCFSLALAGLYSQTSCLTCMPTTNGLTITSSITPETCTGNGAATIAVTGGSGNYSITWNTIPVQTGATATNLAAGTYYVVVIDSAGGGCSGTAVTIPYVGPVLTTTVTNVTCSSPGSATANVSGGTAPYTYSWTPSGGNAAVANNLSAGIYTVTVTDSTGCVVSAIDTVENAMTVNTSSSPDSCPSPAGVAQAIPSGGQAPYSYNWMPGGQTTALVSNLVAGSYTVNVTDAAGCVVSSVVTVAQLNNQMSVSITGTPAPLLCGDSWQLNAGTNYPSTTFSWAPATYLSNPNIQNPVAVIFGNITYTVTATSPCGTATDSIALTLSGINPHDEQICLVTVDTAIHKTVVTWERVNSPPNGSYNIYREATTIGLYTLLASQSVSQFTSYTDMTSNPLNYANRYRISTVDSCGFESDISPHHRGIFLQLSYVSPSGYLLLWTPYEGMAVATYNIYRGTSSSNLTFIATTPGAIYNYTDLNPPAGTSVYLIETVHPDGGCLPSLPFINVNSSLSNLAYVTMIGVNENEYAENSFSISPNPTSSDLTIQTTSSQPQPYSIFDLTGKLLQSGTTSGEKTIIDVQLLPAGMYFLQVGNEGKIQTLKFVKADQ